MVGVDGEDIDDCVVDCVGEAQSESKIQIEDNTVSRPRILVQEEARPATIAHFSCTLVKQAMTVMLLEFRLNHSGREMAARAAATRV